MHWIYILKCKDNYLYIGETTRLYRRFWEHLTGNGGLNTSIYNPENIIAIYKSTRISNFIRYNDLVNNNKLKSPSRYLLNFNEDRDMECEKLKAENYITECLMIHNPLNFPKIKGGKYTRFDTKYNLPKYETDIPLCKCKLPCDVKQNDNGFLYFRCAKKNMWDSFREEFGIIDEPCNYYEEYLNDISKRKEEHKLLKFKQIENEIKDKIQNEYLIDSDD